ncbi:metallophosphoesterase [Bradyrhizobium lablabi]|uniref:metallophosphoesterase n=1 Tax=Bradyrhizobium lablabi TaxID=722472 RepID=UPI00090B687E|nr:metallophosphoesterase [Bradyrhizobium lablabi]SHM85334.1 serine/threonine protein phosphatase 1 [Bradyrhizobium lablabi]
MSFTYAIPDVHGRLDLVQAALARVVSHAAGKQATIVTLGDYVDRGPNSRGVIECLMGWKSETLTLVALKGNHEAMMWETCNNLAELGRWVENGGGQTLASYGVNDTQMPNLPLVLRAHLNWIADLALMHVDRHRVFVHAGVDPKIPLNRQSEQTLLWKRYVADFYLGHGERHVVHGHHADPKAPLVTSGKTNLDGLAWKTGRLVIGVFDDDRPGGAVEFLEVDSDAKNPNDRAALPR